MNLKPIFDQAGIRTGETVYIALDCSTLMPMSFYEALREAMRVELDRGITYRIFAHDMRVNARLTVGRHDIAGLFTDQFTLPIGGGCMYSAAIEAAQEEGATTLFMITDAYGIMPPLVATMDLAIFTLVPESILADTASEFALYGPVVNLEWEAQAA